VYVKQGYGLLVPLKVCRRCNLYLKCAAVRPLVASRRPSKR